MIVSPNDRFLVAVDYTREKPARRNCSVGISRVARDSIPSIIGEVDVTLVVSETHTDRDEFRNGLEPPH